jgi:crotonobetainyl-CoA:carnitine CoA-transferase CaiB-like acyl-CoA transferase
MMALQDVTVIAVEQYGAGPWATLQLADLGARVIKIEDPQHGGDVSRYVPPYQEGQSSLFFETFNRNKESVSLDLRHPLGRGVFEDLVRGADAVFSNLRGDQPEKLGLRYGDLAGVNERIVCCSLSGFGATGPRRTQGGYDYTIQGIAGWQSLTGGPDEPPTKSGLSLVDFCGGHVAALAIVAGIWQARRDGVGLDADLSLFEVALAELTYIGTWVASRDYVPVRRADSAHQSMVPFQNFATADGWIVVACPKETLWRRLCAVLERESLADDARFSSFAARAENRDALLAILAPLFHAEGTATWLERLNAADVPCGEIQDVASALDDPQTRARQAVVEIDHPELGRVRQVASPLRLSSAAAPLRRGPLLGEHTAEVLHELCGYSAQHIEELANAGVFGRRRVE